MKRLVHSRVAAILRLSTLAFAAQLFLFVPQASGQEPTAEEIAAREAVFEAELPAERIRLTEEFLTRFPDSRFKRGLLRLALLEAAELDPQSALVADYAERFFDAESARQSEAQACYRTAWTLFRLDPVPDITSTYAEKALSLLSEESTPYTRAQVLHMVAHYRSASGRIAEAIELQREALPLMEESLASRGSINEYSLSVLVQIRGALGRYLLAGGELDEAEGHVAWAAIHEPDNPQFRLALDDLAARRAEEGVDQETYKEALMASVADSVLEDSVDRPATELKIARSFATLGVLEERALEFATALVRDNGPDTGIRAYFDARVALAQVQAALGDCRSAHTTLEEVAQLATNHDTDYYVTSGRCLEELGHPQDAIASYLEVVCLADEPLVLDRLEPLWERVHGTERSIESACEKVVADLESWQPEAPFDLPSKWKGRVVLAELFTGADCAPCMGPNYAYRHLMEHYPSEALAVLVYHHHIPLPDPMTNPDTDARWAYYEPEIGTPSSRVNGIGFYDGGGVPAIGRSLFSVYGWSIERELLRAPLVEIDLTGERLGAEVSFEVSVRPTESVMAEDRDLKLRLVLAQKEVRYVGLNELDTHRMVVRDIISGPDGYPIDASNEVTVVTEIYDLAELEADLLAYLADFEENPTMMGEPAPWLKETWRGFPDKACNVTESELVLVAFVQDDRTREVLQAASLELH